MAEVPCKLEAERGGRGTMLAQQNRMSHAMLFERALLRARSGQHTAILGVAGFEPASETLYAVRIDCARSDRPLGPILEADRRLEQLLRQLQPPSHGSIAPPGQSRLIADAVEGPGHVVELANRFQRQLDRPAALLFESIDAADDPSLELLRRIIRARGMLQMPLVLTSRSRELHGEAARLIEALREIEGADAVIVADSVPMDSDVEPHRPRLADPWPIEVARVLRAGATVGNTFEAYVVAELLDLDLVTTLELLQLARDHGAALDDLGDGVFRLTDAFARELRAGITPSLASAWHQQLADLLTDTREVAQDPRRSPPQRVIEADDRNEAYRDLMQKWGAARDFTSRAAEHAEAAGHADLAVEHYLDAAIRAAKVGGYQRAVELLERALHIMSTGAPAASHRVLRVRALLELGRIKWMASGSGIETFTLPAALAELESAASLMVNEDPIELRAELALLTARVSYDIGSPEQLDSACTLLVGARHALLEVGKPLEAARLLNDEAAVRVRRGELATAGELLSEAREMFVRFADASPVAQRELAQTEHLVARLILHAPEHERRDEDALRFALERARAAESGFGMIGDQRERARTWETLARIERLLDKPESAMEHLQSAVQVQSRLGDALGMARTTAALAEILADSGQIEDAVGLLDESVELNLNKGSLSGLAYNRRGLDDLITRMSSSDRQTFAPMLEQLRTRIDTARPASAQREPLDSFRAP